MNKIRILVVAPNEEPYQLKIPHTLKEMQKVVGGLIEYVELEHNVDLICNEEGKLLNLELNRVLGNDIIAGTFFIAGQHKGETISLSRKQIKKYKRIFRLEKDKHFIDYLKTRKVMPEDLVRLVIRKTKALIVEPNKNPYIIEDKHLEDKLYGLIYYPFEKLEIEKDIFLIFSKQAKSNEKMFPKNRQVEGHQIYGTFAVVKIQNKEYVSLTEKEIVELKQYFK